MDTSVVTCPLAAVPLSSHGVKRTEDWKRLETARVSNEDPGRHTAMLTEESFLDFNCPFCGEGLSFPQEDAGQLRECPNCRESVVVPADGSGVGGKPPIPIATARLVLRRLAAGDWKDLLELMSDEQLFRYKQGQPLDEDRILRWLESDSLVRLTTPDQPFFFGVEVKGSGKLIGYCELDFSSPKRDQSELHICLNHDFQHKGFALEALDAVIRFCFEGIRLHRVTARCDSRNAAGCRLLENVGMRREGEFVKDNFVNGEWVNTIWYAALNEEYRRAAEQTT